MLRSGAKKAFIVKVPGVAHAVQQGKTGNAGAGHGDKGGDAGACGNKYGPSIGGAEDEIAVRTGEMKSAPQSGRGKDGGECSPFNLPNQERQVSFRC